MKKIQLILFLLLFSTVLFAETTYNVYIQILNKLPLCKDSSTGAIDSNGFYTKDSGNGFNCSGFAKWIVDGFYTPLCDSFEAKYISLVNLRRKHITERGTPDILIYEDLRDPYFGLDWTRNLAVELGKKRGENPDYKSYDINSSKISPYVSNCGFPLSKIEDVIKEQMSKENDLNFFFLGSINGFYGENPRLWQHYHIAVFIPYFEDKILKIAVLERNKETSFEYLLSRYPNTWCHLVSISSEGDFELKTP